LHVEVLIQPSLFYSKVHVDQFQHILSCDMNFCFEIIIHQIFPLEVDMNYV